MYTYNLNVYEFYVFFKTMATLALAVRNVFEKLYTYSYFVWLINK